MSNNLHKLLRKYENKCKQQISYLYPIVIRIDGMGTKENKIDRTDPQYIKAMCYAVKKILATLNSQKNSVVAYIHSDEISIVIEPLTGVGGFLEKKHRDTQKIVSAVASLATLNFNKIYKKKEVGFDVRVFNVPQKQVQSYLIWRQKITISFQVQHYAKKYIPYSERRGANARMEQLIRILAEKNFSWDGVKNSDKYGILIQNGTEYAAPLFVYNKDTLNLNDFIKATCVEKI